MTPLVSITSNFRYASSLNSLFVLNVTSFSLPFSSYELKNQLVDQAGKAFSFVEKKPPVYMFRLLARKAVMSNPQRYGFFTETGRLLPVVPIAEVERNNKSINNLAQFAESKGITYAQLKDANPWLRDSSFLYESEANFVHTFLKYQARRECTMIRKRHRRDRAWVIKLRYFSLS